jgi:hypothetical protein
MSAIDPSKATPQAPRVLRVGSKGHARAQAAAAAGKPPPDKEPDDDEDEDEEDNVGYDDAPAPGEPDTEGMSAAAEACRTASDACGRAQEQLDACATELEGGTDSISTLTATETACDEAIEELQEAKAKCSSLRGAAPETEEESAPPVAPMQARALAKAAPAATAEAHVETARLAELGRYTLGRLGLTAADTVKAKGVLGGKLDLADLAAKAQASEAKIKAKSDDAARLKLWEDGVRSRRVRLTQAFTREEYVGAGGKPASRRVFSAWAKRQNALYPELEAFEAWMSSLTPEPGTTSEEPSTLLSDAAHKKHASAALTERDRLEARRAGVDPDVLAAQVAMMNRGQGRDEERV